MQKPIVLTDKGDEASIELLDCCVLKTKHPVFIYGEQLNIKFYKICLIQIMRQFGWYLTHLVSQGEFRILFYVLSTIHQEQMTFPC